MFAPDFSQPLDRLSLGFMGALGLVMAVLGGGHLACQSSQTCWLANPPRVESFTWQDRTLGAEDRAFILTFDRAMDQKDVEKRLQITPPLAGKISWVGRRLAFTLEEPIPYGQKFRLNLEQARAHLGAGNLRPFEAQFQSRDQAFAYIGASGAEQGRVVYQNLTRNQKIILTPPNLTVIDFRFYPQGDALLFAAADSQLGFEGLRQLQLYRAPIPLNLTSAELPPPELILDNQGFQNNQFDLSRDGKTIVVQRVNRENPADFDLWMISENQEPQRLKVMGGDFKIAPDGQSLAVARGEGISIFPLRPEAKPLDFLPKFGQLLNFSPDGTAAAVVNFNTDNAQKRYQRSLFYVNNTGGQKELLNTEGSILHCEFTGGNRRLYCLLTHLIPGETYQEQPYFAEIDLQSGKIRPLVALPDYRDIKVSLAPDGLGILFDQVLVGADVDDTGLSTGAGEAVTGGRLWLLTPPRGSQGVGKLRELVLGGIRPRWAP
ncbi:MAG: hypothetical protein ACK5CA_01435 [Cyanobacteriota bacterium]|jgi:hypothetical protein